MSPEEALRDQHDKIIEHLDRLNVTVAKQNSLPRMLVVGLVYGIGFFLGSAIIATIALGVLGPLFADIPWVRDAYENGSALGHY